MKDFDITGPSAGLAVSREALLVRFRDIRSLLIDQFDGAVAVSPKKAAKALDCSERYVYQLIHAGKLTHYREGSARRIVVVSIADHVVERLAAGASMKTLPPGAAKLLRPTPHTTISPTSSPQRRKRGRPRKVRPMETPTAS
jgi:excisionase family DNA binding protein